MEDTAQSLKILKAIENQALQAKHARENQVAKVPITKEVYDVGKAKSSTDTAIFRSEIVDLKGDLTYVDADIAEVQVIRRKP